MAKKRKLNSNNPKYWGKEKIAEKPIKEKKLLSAWVTIPQTSFFVK